MRSTPATVAPRGSGRPRSALPPALVRRAVVASVVLAASGRFGVPQARALDFGAGIATTYDDNILNYSDRDLFAFRYR